MAPLKSVFQVSYGEWRSKGWGPLLYELPVMENVPKPDKLIHGDFNPTNVICTSQDSVVIDFENACYSSHEYEIANTIYMTVFDCRHRISQFQESEFVEGFVCGYKRNGQPDLPAIRALVGERVSMLKNWLDDPASAPLSVASSSSDWKQELRDFITSFEQGKFGSVLERIDSPTDC